MFGSDLSNNFNLPDSSMNQFRYKCIYHIGKHSKPKTTWTVHNFEFEFSK